jgi:3-oxoacyl-[acyl-carrier protein] reductase
MTALNGKIALVTGSSRGIGRAVAMRLAKEGALVAVHYGKNRDTAEEVVREITQGGGRRFSDWGRSWRQGWSKQAVQNAG